MWISVASKYIHPWSQHSTICVTSEIVLIREPVLFCLFPGICYLLIGIKVWKRRICMPVAFPSWPKHQPIEDEDPEDAGRRRPRVRHLLAASLLHITPASVRPESERLVQEGPQAVLHPVRAVARRGQQLRQSVRLLLLQLQLPKRGPRHAGTTEIGDNKTETVVRLLDSTMFFHTRRPYARLPACPHARLPACPPARLPACPPARLPACPPARLPACPPARVLWGTRSGSPRICDCIVYDVGFSVGSSS